MFVQIQLLEGLLESWSEYENNVQCLKTWFETQEKRLKQQHRIGDQTSVQNALKDCQVMARGLKCLSHSVMARTTGILRPGSRELNIENSCIGCNEFLWLYEFIEFSY